MSRRIAFTPLLVILLAGFVQIAAGSGKNGPTPSLTSKPTRKEDVATPNPTRTPTAVPTVKPTRVPTTAKPTKKPNTPKPTLMPSTEPPRPTPTLAPIPPPPPVGSLTTTVTATAPLAAGLECENIPCTGTIYPNGTGIPQALDLLLLFDSTGSMAGTIDTAKAQALALLAALRAAGMTNLQAAVADHKDYIGTFTTPACGSISSGGVGDYVWKLDQAMTAVDTAVQTAIAGLAASGGGDGPEAYLSALYHAHTDATIGWRGGGVAKVVVLFSDNVPHTCTSVTCPNTLNTGIEPGADLVLGNGDDLTIDNVIAGLQATRTTVFQLGPVLYPVWDCMTAATGGTAKLLGTDISLQIVNLVTVSLASIASLTLEPCTATDSAYLKSVTPTLYHNVTHSDADQHFSFNATVCPPSTATTGAHPVSFCLKADGPTLATTKIDCDVK